MFSSAYNFDAPLFTGVCVCVVFFLWIDGIDGDQ